LFDSSIFIHLKPKNVHLPPSANYTFRFTSGFSALQPGERKKLAFAEGEKYFLNF
jgi:hypothetical protein